MRSGRNLTRYLPGLIVGLALLLPTMSLVILGGIWLWQKGYVLMWMVGALIATAVGYLLQLWILRKGRDTGSDAAVPSDLDETELRDPSWSEREGDAWEEVLKIAASVEPEHLTSREAFLLLGRRTIEAVAQKVHPEVKDPLLQFTVPEALMLSERVSHQMRTFVVDNIPLGDQLTVAQMATIYNWRSVIYTAGKAYNFWRIIRLLNPLTAATQEAREQLSKKMYEWSRDKLATILAQHYVKEVGRAAIDLYGGRLRVTTEALAGYVSESTKSDREQVSAQLAEPLRILVLGSVGAGKSSLINVLSDEVRAAVDMLPVKPSFTPYEINKEGMPAALILDSPGLTGDPNVIKDLIAEAANCDMAIWVVSAHRADRENDRIAIEMFHQHFAKLQNRRRPPMFVVLSHVDRLRPFQEWHPPYDVVRADSEKAKSIRAAMETVSNDLEFPTEDIIPACLDEAIGSYNADLIWTKILDLLPEAQRSRLVRCLSDAGQTFEWRRLWRQAANAGRVISRVVVN